LRLLSRLHITIDDVNDTQSLTAQNETLQRFDIISVCPGNAQVFTSLCRSADIDIISLDFTHKVSFPLNKKIIDEAVQRGVVFEILYVPIVASSSSSGVRREIYAGTRVLLQYLRGHSVLLSSGTDAYSTARGPLDVNAVAESLGLSKEQAMKSICETPARVVKRAAERKARTRSPQALSVSEVLRRFPEVARRHHHQSSSGQLNSATSATATHSTTMTDLTLVSDNDQLLAKEFNQVIEDGMEINREEGNSDDDSVSDKDENRKDDDDDDGFLQFSSSSISRFKEVDEQEQKQESSMNLDDINHVADDSNGDTEEEESNRQRNQESISSKSDQPAKKQKLLPNHSSSSQSISNSHNNKSHNKQPFKAVHGGHVHQKQSNNKSQSKPGHFSSLYKHKFDHQYKKKN
jgi:RNase P/RNase MRP subunit p30